MRVVRLQQEKLAAVLGMATVLATVGCGQMEGESSPAASASADNQVEHHSNRVAGEHPLKGTDSEAESSLPETPPKLDLTLPSGVVERPGPPDWAADTQETLPDLFAENNTQGSDGRLSIGGRVLLKEEERNFQDYRDAIEGGEFRLKLKIP